MWHSYLQPTVCCPKVAKITVRICPPSCRLTSQTATDARLTYLTSHDTSRGAGVCFACRLAALLLLSSRPDAVVMEVDIAPQFGAELKVCCTGLVHLYAAHWLTLARMASSPSMPGYASQCTCHSAFGWLPDRPDSLLRRCQAALPGWTTSNSSIESGAPLKGNTPQNSAHWQRSTSKRRQGSPAV